MSPLAPGARPVVAWALFPRVLARVPGIPRSLLAGCRFRDALALLACVREAKAALHASGVPLAARLHPLVPRLDRTSARRGALAARRALFHVRPLPGGGWLEQVRALDGDLARDLEGWALGRGAYVDLLARLDAAFDREAPERDAHLAALLRSEPLRRALELSSPTLAARLDRLPPGPLAALSPGDRKVVAQAARYLQRAAMKPIPCGHLAGTFLAEITEAPPGPPPDLTARRVIVRPNRRVFRRLAAALLERPAVRERATVHLSPGCFLDGGACWALAPGWPPSYRPVSEGEALFEIFAGLPRGGAPYAVVLRRAGRPRSWIERMIAEGALELHDGASEARADDIEVLLARLGEAAGAAGASAAAPAPASAAAPASASAAASAPAPAPASAPASASAERAPPAEERPAGQKPEPLAFEDTAGIERLRLPSRDLAPFLAEMARFGGGYLFPGLLPEEDALLRLHRALYPGEARVPLLRFHRDYLDVCRRRGLDPSPWVSLHALARGSEPPAADPCAPLRRGLIEAIERAGGGEARYEPDLAALAGWDAAACGRMSLRCAPAPGGRFHPTLWGGDRMSLLPRYLHLFPGDGGRIEREARSWLARWPEVMDVYGSFGENPDLRPALTRRTIDAPGCRPRPDGLSPRDLLVTAEGGRLTLVAGSAGPLEGKPVVPVFLGVSGPHARPALAQLLDQLSGRRASLIELLYRALNQIIGRRLLDARGVERIPPILLGEHTLLSPELFIVPTRAMPAVRLPVDREGFFAFHGWLAAEGLPSHAQVRVTARDPLWVDLDHPIGVQSFLKLARGHERCLMSPPLLRDDELTLHGSGGSHEIELYVEIAAGTAVAGAVTP